MFNFYVNSSSSMAEICEPGGIADSNFVDKNEFDEINQLLIEAERNLSQTREVVHELWSCLEDSEAELEETRAELAETRQLLAEALSEFFTFISEMVEDDSNPNFQLLQTLVPFIREAYLQKD